MRRLFFARLLPLCLLCVCLLPQPLRAEGGVETSFQAEIGGHILIKPLSWELSEEWRLHSDLTTERFSHALTLGCKPWRYLKFTATYNLINGHDADGWEIRHRCLLGGTAGYATKRHEWSFRSLWQSTYRVGVSDVCRPALYYVEDGSLFRPAKYRSNPKYYWRNRVEYAYNIRHCRFSPFVSAEFFYLTNDYEQNKIDKWRFMAGTDYKLDKKHYLRLSIRYTSCTDDDDASAAMVGVGYKFKL